MAPEISRSVSSNRLSSGGSLLPQNLVGLFAFPRSNRLSSGGSLLPQNLTNTVHRTRDIPRYCLGILSAWPQKLVMSFAFPRSNRLTSGGTLLPQNLVGSFAFLRNNRLSSGGSLLSIRCPCLQSQNQYSSRLGNDPATGLTSVCICWYSGLA